MVIEKFDLYCSECAYTPDMYTMKQQDKWEEFWDSRERAKALGYRPWCVGGVPYAYNSA